MHKPLYAGLALALALSAGANAAAQPLQWNGSITLAQAIDRVETAGFGVRKAQADARSASAHADATRANLFPQASISATTLNGGITQLGMPYAQQNFVSAYVTVPIFAPTTYEQARSTTRAAQAAGFTARGSVNDAMLSAVQAYEGALLTQAVFAAREVTVSYEQRHLDDVEQSVKAGAAPRYVLAESQAAFAMAQQSAEDAAAQRDEANNDLKVTLDFDLAAPLTLADSLEPIPMRGTESAIEARALTQRPDVLAANAQMQAEQSRIAAARAQYLPTITGTAETYNGGSTPFLGSHGYQVGISASVPVLDGGSRPAALHEAQADLARAQTALDEAQLSAQRDVANAWREYEAAQRNLVSAQTGEAAAAETLRVASLRERSGKGITLETLSALSQDAAAREATLVAVARLNVAIAAVHRAAGDSSIE